LLPTESVVDLDQLLVDLTQHRLVGFRVCATASPLEIAATPIIPAIHRLAVCMRDLQELS
jgi:hypothetical protein